MLALIQRVSSANVSIDGATIANIEQGILALIGIEKSDTEAQANKLLDKILSYRIFEDSNEKMNLNIKDIDGSLLLVSQFTLVAETKSGTRPGFSTAMPPEESKQLFENLLKLSHQKYSKVANGIFGADMQVTLCNDGPVTFILKA